LNRATFKILAKDLLANGAKKVVLFVSHGIFSKGIDTLFESGIHKVYTKDGLVGVSPQIEQ
jgi:ribose-phosphate pyrophosphokinase